MNLLVTGGSGYIGSALVSSLARMGHAVRVFDLRPPAHFEKHSNCEFVPGNLLNASEVSGALPDIECVYHLAWSFYPEDYRREIKENLAATLNLLEACRTSKVHHLIFASSAVVYGPTGTKPAHEDDACHPERSSIGGPSYGIIKLACEEFILALQDGGRSVTIMRIHGVFSENRLGQFSEMIERAAEGKDVSAIREAGGQYTHLDDAVSALCLALGRKEALGEVFNVAGSRIYRDSDIADHVVETAGTASKVALLEDSGRSMISVSIDKISRQLGYRPREDDFLSELISAS